MSSSPYRHYDEGMISSPYRDSPATSRLRSGALAGDAAEVAAALADGADPREPDMFSYCPLTLAANALAFDCCRLILQAHPEEARRHHPMFKGGAMLHFACSGRDRTELAALLLPLADLLAEDQDGRTPMVAAALYYQPDGTFGLPSMVDAIVDEFVARGHAFDATMQLSECLGALGQPSGALNARSPMAARIHAKLLALRESIAIDAVALSPACGPSGRAPRI